MQNLNAWLLTEGAHGMVSQVEGLAKALNLNFIHKKIIYNSFFSFLPPRFSPQNKIVFNFDEMIHDVDLNQLPNIFISCGRKSVIPSIVLKDYFSKTYHSKFYNIHIQDPKINFNYFDFIIAPEHDRLVGDNVFSSKGAIHYISHEEIEKARLSKKNNSILTVILGGPNKYYNFALEELKNIFTYIDNNFLSNFSQLLIISSRRTPESINNFLIEKYKNNNKVQIDNSLKRENYINALAHADRIIVTSDSISMISEAATTGSPIHVAQLKSVRNDYRFIKFLDLFKDLNIVKSLEEKQENWTYDKLYETKRIADLIKNKIL